MEKNRSSPAKTREESSLDLTRDLPRLGTGEVSSVDNPTPSEDGLTDLKYLAPLDNSNSILSDFSILDVSEDGLEPEETHVLGDRLAPAGARDPKVQSTGTQTFSSYSANDELDSIISLSGSSSETGSGPLLPKTRSSGTNPSQSDLTLSSSHKARKWKSRVGLNPEDDPVRTRPSKKAKAKGNRVRINNLPRNAINLNRKYKSKRNSSQGVSRPLHGASGKMGFRIFPNPSSKRPKAQKMPAHLYRFKAVRNRKKDPRSRSGKIPIIYV